MSNTFTFSDKINLFNSKGVVGEQRAANNTRRASNTTRMPATAMGSDAKRGQYYSYVFKLDDVDIRSVLKLFYMTYNKEKVDTVDDILGKYKGDEILLLQQLCEKYSISYDEIAKFINDIRAESNRKKGEVSDYRRASMTKKAAPTIPQLSPPPPPPPLAKANESVNLSNNSPKVHEEVSTDNDEGVVYLPEPWKTKDNERTDSTSRKASISNPVVPPKSQLNNRNFNSPSSNENQGNRLDKKDLQIELLKRDLAEARKELQATAKESKQILELFESLKTANSVVEKSPNMAKSYNVKFDETKGVKFVDSEQPSNDITEHKQQAVPPEIQLQLDSMKQELERTRTEMQNVMYNSPVASRYNPAIITTDPFSLEESTRNVSPPKYMQDSETSQERNTHSQSINKMSRDTDSTPPFDDSDWVECYDPKFKRNYYFSLSKRKSVWIRPSNTLAKSYVENTSLTTDRWEYQHHPEYNNDVSTRKLGPTPRSSLSHSNARTPTPERSGYDKGRYAFPPKGATRLPSPINSRNPLVSSKQDLNMREQLRSTSKEPVQKHGRSGTRSLSPAISGRGHSDLTRSNSPNSNRNRGSPIRGRIYGDANSYVSSAWKCAVDPKTNRRYYYHKQSGLSTWRRPADYFD